VGRLVELAGSAAATARTTVAVREVVRLQREGELVAWVQVRGGTFYPPDAAEAGVELASLTVVHVPSSALEAARAAELLLRSGAFGLVVVDLEGMVDARLPTRALARLHALCRQHGSTVAFLTPPALEALGSLVALRLEPRRRTVGDVHPVESTSLRDKVGYEPARSVHRGPLGLTSHDEALPQQAGVVVPFRRRATDEATLPLPFFEEARDAG
jgi:recombination protein RecA